MMSMKGDGKPVSFIEDCAVPLEHLAEYTDRLTKVFEQHGTPAPGMRTLSVGTLHVRPILNMRRMAHKNARHCRRSRRDGEASTKALIRASMAMGWCAANGSRRFSDRTHAAFGGIKDIFDPKGLLNPGKIVRPRSRMTVRCFVSSPATNHSDQTCARLDGMGWLDKAVEMCNNNGHCRKFDAGTMCPSFRVTREEQHLTRGRANTLRLALSGQLGADADSTSDECSQGDGFLRVVQRLQARMPDGRGYGEDEDRVPSPLQTAAWLHAERQADCHLPHYAPWVSKLGPLANLAQALGKGFAGFASQRSLPKWKGDAIRDSISDTPFTHLNQTTPSPRLRGEGWGEGPVGNEKLRASPTLTPTPPAQGGRGVTLAVEAAAVEESALQASFIDTFNNYFDPENAHAALKVLQAAGYTVPFAASQR